MDRYFKLTERGSNLVTEVRAGTATFMTLCYILAGLHSALRSFAPLHITLTAVSFMCSKCSPAERFRRSVRVLTGAG